MNIYIHLFLISLVTIYIVDISGFTQSWRDALARWLKVSSLRPLKPFDCGACTTWWVCIIFALLSGQFSIFTIAFSALLSLLSNPLGNALIFIREGMTWLINRIMP